MASENRLFSLPMELFEEITEYLNYKDLCMLCLVEPLNSKRPAVRILYHRDHLDHTNINEPSALHWGAHHNILPTAQRAIDCGANINRMQRWHPNPYQSQKSPPIHLAAEQGHDDMVRFLLSKGAGKNSYARVYFNDFPTMVAPAVWAHRMRRRMLLASLRGKFNPLYMAIKGGHESTARLLLAKGSSTRVREPQRDELNAFHAIHAAAFSGMGSLCSHLVTHHGVEIDILDHKRRTPLIWALCSEEGVDSLRELINLQADVNYQIEGEMGTIGIASYISDVYSANKALHILFEAGADPNLPVLDGPKPLVYIMARGEPQLIRTMIRRGAVLDLTDWPINSQFDNILDQYQFSLDVEMKNKIKTCVKNLLSRTDSRAGRIGRILRAKLRARINQQHGKAAELLHHHGVRLRQTEVKHILETPAIFSSISDEALAFMICFYRNNSTFKQENLLNTVLETKAIRHSVVARLINSKLNIHWTNERGHTFLHILLSNIHYMPGVPPDIFNALLERGINVNAKTHRKETVLHFLALHPALFFWESPCFPKILETLSQSGLDVNAKNSRGETPLHLLARSEHSGDWYRRAETLIELGVDRQQRDRQGKTAWDRYLSQGNNEEQQRATRFAYVLSPARSTYRPSSPARVVERRDWEQTAREHHILELRQQILEIRREQTS